jgi:hypothetical protein
VKEIFGQVVTRLDILVLAVMLVLFHLAVYIFQQNVGGNLQMNTFLEITCQFDHQNLVEVDFEWGQS